MSRLTFLLHRPKPSYADLFRKIFSDILRPQRYGFIIEINRSQESSIALYVHYSLRYFFYTQLYLKKIKIKTVFFL